MSVNSINANSLANIQQTYISQQSAGKPTDVTVQQASALQEDTVTLGSGEVKDASLDKSYGSEGFGSSGILPPE